MKKRYLGLLGLPMLVTQCQPGCTPGPGPGTTTTVAATTTMAATSTTAATTTTTIAATTTTAAATTTTTSPPINGVGISPYCGGPDDPDAWFIDVQNNLLTPIVVTVGIQQQLINVASGADFPWPTSLGGIPVDEAQYEVRDTQGNLIGAGVLLRSEGCLTGP